ncbi:hypothetical protein [Dysgonomonas sp. 25]|uniref:hypothetical protein n=1 Tax=Dysgonomonas sp. 25 TaxID=2302933 RepID=UPI0013D26BAD|nr:hypothetical protein [Dysgonomonas sp. 25]NDV69931.1 hypothetical protein [Dysgonomonas sp. 25]
MEKQEPNKFLFRQDEEQLIISRTYFTIAANSKEEAISILESFERENIHDCYDERIHIENSELEMGTIISLTPGETINRATLNIYDADKEFPIISNLNKPISITTENVGYENRRTGRYK